MTPFVSIGLPVFNGEEFLSIALESLLGQTYEDFELIICDNASTDHTEEICRVYALKDRRIRYHRNSENLGAAKNYNLAFEMSRGRYFKWACHDDVCAPDFLNRCVEVFEQAPRSVVLCYPRTTLIDEQGQVTGTYDDNMDIRFTSAEKRLGRLVRNLRMCNALFGLIRAESLRRTRLIGGYFASDVTLLIELCLQGQFWEIGENLFFRRRHAGMSRVVNRSYSDVCNWFDTSNRGGHDIRLINLFFKGLGSISNSHVRAEQKAGCYLVLTEEWMSRYWRAMGGELKGVLRSKLRGPVFRHKADRKHKVLT